MQATCKQIDLGKFNMTSKIKQMILEELETITWTRGDGFQGIPHSEIKGNFPPMLYDEFIRFMNGQTIASLNDSALYYVEDVRRFLQGKPNLD